MYYLDGKDVALTHYCALGNQPKMRAAASTDPVQARLQIRRRFQHQPGERRAHARPDPHVRRADRLRAEWTHYDDGKSTGVKTFEMVRKK